MQLSGRMLAMRLWVGSPAPCREGRDNVREEERKICWRRKQQVGRAGRDFTVSLQFLDKGKSGRELLFHSGLSHHEAEVAELGSVGKWTPGCELGTEMSHTV